VSEPPVRVLDELAGMALAVVIGLVLWLGILFCAAPEIFR